jgi:hypothetical protein
MAKVTANGIEQQERLICVEKGYAGDSGEAMFDAKGEPLQRWKEIEQLLSEYEVDLERTKDMCGVLGDYGLLESFSMQATLDKGGAMQLAGMYRVDENKIGDLNASQLKNLVKKGIMGRIYAHLLSLENFTGLLERKAKASA